ncbi:MAG TPA: hypothetical protein VM261_20795 [Kofleriaceae bacterium]|nr:hypothetical protein [Kofleriaceae bacterium]
MNRGRSVFVATTLVAALSGCFHVALQAPPRDAPVEARVAAYQQLRQTGQLHTITTNQYGAQVDHEVDLVTASGMTVKHADDLIPVLDEHSAAARTARASGSARQKKWLWIVGGTVVSTVGFGMMWSGMNANFDDPDGMAGQDRANLGIGLGIGGAVAGAIGWYYYRHVEVSQRAATFANYDDGLRARLDLCVQGLQLVDCAAVTPASARAPASTPP